MRVDVEHRMNYKWKKNLNNHFVESQFSFSSSSSSSISVQSSSTFYICGNSSIRHFHEKLASPI